MNWVRRKRIEWLEKDLRKARIWETMWEATEPSLYTVNKLMLCRVFIEETEHKLKKLRLK